MSTCAEADVVVRFGTTPEWLDGLPSQDRQEWLGGAAGKAMWPGAELRGWILHSGAFFLLSYGDGVTFVIDREGKHVWTRWPPSLTFEDAVTYLLGPVLGFVLRLRGRTCLHACAFVTELGAIAVMGDAGYGKSTTAAAFAQQGYPVLTDDITVLGEVGSSFHVVPAYPQIKLWPDSAALLFGVPEALDRICPSHPDWDKRYIDLNSKGFSFARESVPLSAVYALQPREMSETAPFVGDLSSRDRLAALVENTYGAYLVGAVEHAQAFKALARLASTVPVRSITPSVNPERIGRLCSLILDDAARITPASQLSNKQ